MNTFTFVPLLKTSDRARSIIAKQKAQFEANKDKYPPGIKEQYEILLRNLENEDEIQFEVFLFPFAFPESFPDPTKPYCNLLHQLVHPFSRGTIVCSGFAQRILHLMSHGGSAAH